MGLHDFLSTKRSQARLWRFQTEQRGFLKINLRSDVGPLKTFRERQERRNQRWSHSVENKQMQQMQETIMTTKLTLKVQKKFSGRTRTRPDTDKSRRMKH